MAFKASLLIGADAKDAIGALGTTSKELDKVKASTSGMGVSARSGANSIKTLTNAEAASAAAAQNLANKQALAQKTTIGLGNANKLAAGQVGNLTAQFNDIGVMLAAGQNPLQLALQQGTQITQVIGPMGAAGAVHALKTALIGMINPVSIITIGSIAAGAAMFQWLTASGEEAKSLEDILGELEKTISDYTKANDAAEASTEDMAKRFGVAASEARKLLNVQKDLARQQQQQASGAALKAVANGIGVSTTGSGTDFQSIRDFFKLKSTRREHRTLAGQINADFANIGAASTGSIQDQITATEKLIANWQHAASAVGGVTNQEKTQLATLEGILVKLYEIRQTEGGGITTNAALLVSQRQQLQTQKLIAQFGSNSAQVANQRIAIERESYAQKVKQLKVDSLTASVLMDQFDALNPLRDAETERIARANKFAAQTRIASNEQLASAKATLSSLQDENSLREIAIKYGTQSVQYSQELEAQERKVLEKMLQSLDVAESLKDQIRAAWEEGQVLNNTPMDQGIEQAAAAAKRMTDDIVRAVQAAQTLASQGQFALEDAEIRLKYTDDPVGQARELARSKMVRTQKLERDGADPRDLAYLDAKANAYAETMAKVAIADKKRLDALKANRSGSGGGGTKKQVEALSKLIEKEQLELAMLRETDPVQKEMIRNREALKGATQGEIQAVEDMIRSRIKEAKEINAANDFAKGLADDLRTAINGPIQSFEDLDNAAANAIGSVASRLRNLMLDPVFDQLAQQIADILQPKTASGGGIGGILGSIGSALFPKLGKEAVQTTAPSGAISAASAGKAGAAAAPKTIISITNNSSAHIADETRETMDSQGNRRTEFVIADAVGRALQTPGGAAKRHLNKGLGLRVPGPRR